MPRTANRSRNSRRSKSPRRWRRSNRSKSGTSFNATLLEMEFTMKLNKPLCILCWTISIPFALALIALTALGQEQLPAGLNVVSMEVKPAAVELKHEFDYRQVLVTGKLSTGESVDLTRMVKM